MTPGSATSILLSANTSWYLYNFRRNLINELVRRGIKVTIAAPDNTYAADLIALGCNIVEISMDNRGTNPLRDSLTLLRYLNLYATLRPDYALHFTIKPVVYGSIASRHFGIPTINTITGLGSSFLGSAMIRGLSRFLLRSSMRKSNFVVFQNHSDAAYFLEHNLVKETQIIRVSGSGVDLTHFAREPYPEHNRDRFVLIARMLTDKGVREFVGCAKQCRNNSVDADFVLAGPLESAHSGGIPESEITEWVNSGYVSYIPKQDDIRPCIARATCVVLPSYREGMARVLMEACAMARPVIATDVPGCSDIVQPYRNGLLCQPRDSLSLYAKVKEFIEMSKAQKKEMGNTARLIAEELFSDQNVNRRYLSLINKVLNLAE